MSLSYSTLKPSFKISSAMFQQKLVRLGKREIGVHDFDSPECKITHISASDLGFIT
uniref:Uncharacterized protein n=1 Tax=Physcomitrium patens TaxID=3218 RepID=A0A2K1KPG8_PHYPA|nr:hypothetical protein PHYPA_006575 [Physcomitrium patens]